jgi:hypothetical protein
MDNEQSAPSHTPVSPLLEMWSIFNILYNAASNSYATNIMGVVMWYELKNCNSWTTHIIWFRTHFEQFPLRVDDPPFFPSTKSTHF